VKRTCFRGNRSGRTDKREAASSASKDEDIISESSTKTVEETRKRERPHASERTEAELVQLNDGSIEIREPITEDNSGPRQFTDENTSVSEDEIRKSKQSEKAAEKDSAFDKLMAILDKHVEAERLEESKNDDASSSTFSSRKESDIRSPDISSESQNEARVNASARRIERRVGSLRFFVEPPAPPTNKKIQSFPDRMIKDVRKSSTAHVPMKSPSSLGVFSKKIVERSGDTMMSPVFGDSADDAAVRSAPAKDGNIDKRPMSLFRRAQLNKVGEG